MNLSLYLSFISYACATTFLPGPNNVLLMAVAGQFGIRSCRKLLLGIWTGLIVVMLLAGSFCAALSTFVPRIVPWFRFVGVAYILYLAWKTFRVKPKEDAIADQKDSDTAAAGRQKTAAPETPPGYGSGFLLQFLNIKVIMLGLAAYPAYFLAEGAAGSSAQRILLFAVSMTVCCGTGNLIWTFLGGLLKPLYDRHCRIVNTVMALLLVWCAVKILRS